MKSVGTLMYHIVIVNTRREIDDYVMSNLVWHVRQRTYWPAYSAIEDRVWEHIYDERMETFE